MDPMENSIGSNGIFHWQKDPQVGQKPWQLARAFPKLVESLPQWLEPFRTVPKLTRTVPGGSKPFPGSLEWAQMGGNPAPTGGNPAPTKNFFDQKIFCWKCFLESKTGLLGRFRRIPKNGRPGIRHRARVARYPAPGPGSRGSGPGCELPAREPDIRHRARVAGYPAPGPGSRGSGTGLGPRFRNFPFWPGPIKFMIGGP